MRTDRLWFALLVGLSCTACTQVAGDPVINRALDERLDDNGVLDVARKVTLIALAGTHYYSTFHVTFRRDVGTLRVVAKESFRIQDVIYEDKVAEGLLDQKTGHTWFERVGAFSSHLPESDRQVRVDAFKVASADPQVRSLMTSAFSVKVQSPNGELLVQVAPERPGSGDAVTVKSGKLAQ